MKKYQRILGFLVIFFPIWAVLFPNFIEREPSIFNTILMLLVLFLTLVYIYANINLIRRIRQLQKLR